MSNKTLGSSPDTATASIHNLRLYDVKEHLLTVVVGIQEDSRPLVACGRLLK